MSANLEDKWFIEDKRTRVLKLKFIMATLQQDYSTMTKEPNGIYIVVLNILGFGRTKGWKFEADSWADAQKEVEVMLRILSNSLVEDLG